MGWVVTAPVQGAEFIGSAAEAWPARNAGATNAQRGFMV